MHIHFSFIQIDESHPAYQVLAEQNSLDLQLYEYVLQLFDEQKAIVEGYDTLLSEVQDPLSSEVIVPGEESSSSSINEDIQVDTNDESPETQIAANKDESSCVQAPKAATPEEELSPLHEAMIAEAL